jgi:transmembrane sensor
VTNSAETARRISTAADLEEAASAWIEQRDRGDWDAAAQSQFDAWFAQSLENRIAYWRLEAAWDRTERLAALRGSETSRASQAWDNQVFRRIAKIGGVLSVLAMAGAAFAFYLSAPRYQTYATTVGGHETLTLSDGSLIELSTDSVIKLVDTAHIRAAKLEKGEAYFEIKHYAAHPFIVTVGDHSVVDLGTKFLIRNDPGRIEVSLFEGRARFDSGGTLHSQAPRVLTPGEVAVATADFLSVTRVPQRNLTAALGWRRGVLVFYHTSLADAVMEFNRYNREPLIIGDESTGHLIVNGAFPTNGVAVFVQAAKDVFGVRVEYRSDGIVISR